jgi:5-(carboxyamino)imidazole ribonucleotide synthase
MQNLIGTMPAFRSGIESFYLHDYGKCPRPGRKLGHVTVVSPAAASRDEALEILAAQLKL